MTAPPDTASARTPHRYFVSYSHQSGFGCTEISLRLPIRGIEDVRVVAALLERNADLTGVVVLNFTKLPDA